MSNRKNSTVTATKSTRSTTKRKAAKRTTTTSKLYNRLNSEKRTFTLSTEIGSTQAGVRIESHGQKKSTNVEIILPSSSPEGEDRTVRVNMTGRQARALYETLNRHYNRTSNV